MQVAARPVDTPTLTRCSICKASMVYFSIAKVSALLGSTSTPLLMKKKTGCSERLRRREKRKMSAEERGEGELQYCLRETGNWLLISDGGFSSGYIRINHGSQAEQPRKEVVNTNLFEKLPVKERTPLLNCGYRSPQKIYQNFLVSVSNCE